MKKWIFTLLFIATHAFAQNLVTNGDFENGLSGWTTNDGVSLASGSAAISGSFSAVLNQDSNYNEGTISQTITTTPGAFYVLKSDANTDFSGSGYCDVIDSYNNIIASIYSGGSRGFVATTNSTTISIHASAGIVDNVQVRTCTFSKPGKYTGILTYTTSYPGVAGVSCKRTIPFTARIDSMGRLQGLGNQGDTISALVLDSEVFSTSMDSYAHIVSSSVDPKTWAISFAAQESIADDLTGFTRLRRWSYSFKYAGK